MWWPARRVLGTKASPGAAPSFPILPSPSPLQPAGFVQLDLFTKGIAAAPVQTSCEVTSPLVLLPFKLNMVEP